VRCLSSLSDIYCDHPTERGNSEQL